MELRVYQYIKNNIRLENLYLYLLVVLAFSLSFFLRSLPYLIAATGMSWLFSKNLKQKIKALYHNRFFLLIFLFYLLHVIGLIYTENTHEGLLNLESKLSLLVLPIIIFSSQSEIKTFYKPIIGAFISGIVISLMICFLVAIYKARLNVVNDEILNFAVWHSFDNWSLLKLIFSGYSLLNYSWFSFFMHPNYFSMYICFAIYLIYYKLITYKKNSKKTVVKNILIIVFFVISLLLLQSRTSIIILLFIVIFETLYNFNSPGKRLFKLSVALLFIASVAFSIVRSERFKSIVKGDTELNYNKLRENNVRIQLWEKAVAVIDNNWLTGLGTGDVQDNFKKVYSKELLETYEGRYLNFHNEYIETTIRLGIPGLIILLVLIFYPLYHHRKLESGYRLLIVFTLIIAVNFFFESMLVRLNGIIFFALFYCLLNIKELDENKISEN